MAARLSVPTRVCSANWNGLGWPPPTLAEPRLQMRNFTAAAHPERSCTVEVRTLENHVRSRVESHTKTAFEMRRPQDGKHCTARLPKQKVGVDNAPAGISTAQLFRFGCHEAAHSFPSRRL